MLQEMKLEDALKKFLQGKEVLVMYNESLEPEKPTYTVESIKEALKNWRFLAEVPAVENQDFKQAVKEMVEEWKIEPARPVKTTTTACATEKAFG